MAASIGASAFAQPCPPLEVRNPNGNYIIPGVKGDIPYANGQALDAYVQPGGARRPAVVVIHGGAWSSGSRRAHVGQLLELLTGTGYHWFSLDYRLGGLARYPDALDDLRAALQFIRCRADELNVDRSKLVLLGEDSGAHLAALLSAERPAGVIGAILLGGLYDLAALPAARGLSPDLVERASPFGRLGPGVPPVLIVHGSRDSEAPLDQARRYCDAVIKTGSRCAFVEVEGASHRSENWWPSQWSYKADIARWLSAIAPVRSSGASLRQASLHKDIVYAPGTGLKLDAWVPPSPRPLPAVIVVHGGGWEAGDKVTYVSPLFEPLGRAGLAWFSIDYRLTPSVTHEQQLDDLRRAIAFARAQHARFNVDPARIVLLGESASGQMVTLVAAEDHALAGVVSFYGVYDLEAMVSDASPRSLLVRLFRRTVLDDAARAILRRYSPIFQAQKKMPPVLLVAGTADSLWPQTQRFAARLAELGVSHDVIALEGAPHGLENWEGHPAWTSYASRMVEWLARVLTLS